MLRIDNIKIYKDITEIELRKEVCKKYKIKEAEITEFYICKKSIDARDKNNIHYTYSVNVMTKNDEKYSKYKIKCLSSQDSKLDIKELKLLKRPIIIGAGPSGLFCALELISHGVKPIIIEQGSMIDKRINDVEKCQKSGKVNPLSNVQFGEGGAGTFSDGKLTTGINDKNCMRILNEFVKFGAPSQILYLNKPHIGTDNLVNIVKNIRNYIIKHGGTFEFDTKVVDFKIGNGKIEAVICNDGRVIESDNVILAIGHSARDTFEMLYNKNIYLERKNFSVGVRIEHKQSDINLIQYGNNYKLKLPPAEYKIVYHGKERSCYSFCMCPGGVVMPSASDNRRNSNKWYEQIQKRFRKCK